jgi:hypothetical protein
MNSNQMRVILGVFSLKAYVIAPKAFHVQGIVRFGQEYGLLATNDEGMYFRINGSQILPMDSDDVRRAIDYSYGVGGRLAASAAHYAVTHPNAIAFPLSSPKVSVRKHRHMEDSDLRSRHSVQAANA